MIEPLFISVWPVLFMSLIYGGGMKLRRQRIDMEGEPPIDKNLFLSSKLAMIIPWALMIFQSFGVNVSMVKGPGLLRPISLVLWASGFALAIVGRIGLGNSFRVGRPKESTRLRVDGLYRFSRNPMYLGLYATLAASALYARQPVGWLAAAFVVAVHHRIVLAEEENLRDAFGDEYRDYCRRVRRYL